MTFLGSIDWTKFKPSNSIYSICFRILMFNRFVDITFRLIESINQLYVYSIGYIVDQFSSESDWVTWIHRSKTISSYCKTKCCCYIAVCLFHFIDSVRELLESFRKTCVSFTLFQRGSSRWMLPSIRCQKPANSFSIPSIFYWQVNVPVEPFFSWRFHVDWNLKVAFLDGTH